MRAGDVEILDDPERLALFAELSQYLRVLVVVVQLLLGDLRERGSGTSVLLRNDGGES